MTARQSMESGPAQPQVELRCPECAQMVEVPCSGQITSHDRVMDLIAGAYNQAKCPGCGGKILVDVPVRVEIPGSPIPSLRYVPFRTLEDPAVLGSILEEPDSTKIVHSMDELERAIERSLLVEQYRSKHRAGPCGAA